MLQAFHFLEDFEIPNFSNILQHLSPTISTPIFFPLQLQYPYPYFKPPSNTLPLVATIPITTFNTIYPLSLYAHYHLFYLTIIAFYTHLLFCLPFNG
jgi:hypothetical protein